MQPSRLADLCLRTATAAAALAFLGFAAEPALAQTNRVTVFRVKRREAGRPKVGGCWAWHRQSLAIGAMPTRAAIARRSSRPS
jgi:hypothetical protein